MQLSELTPYLQLDFLYRLISDRPEFLQPDTGTIGKDREANQLFDTSWEKDGERPDTVQPQLVDLGIWGKRSFGKTIPRFSLVFRCPGGGHHSDQHQ